MLLKRVLPRFIDNSLFLLILNIFSENIAGFSKPLNLLIGFLVIFVFISFKFSVLSRPLSQSKLLLLILAITITIAIYPNQRIYLLFLLINSLFLFSCFSIKCEKSGIDLYAQLLTASFYTTIIFFYENFTFPWFLIQDISIYLSYLTGFLSNHFLDYSPTYSGVLITLSFLIFFLSLLITSKKVNFKILFITLVSTFLIQLVYLIIHCHLLTLPIFYNFDARAWIDINLSLFLLLLIPLFFILQITIPFQFKKNVSPLWIFLLIFLVIMGSSSKSSFSSKSLPLDSLKKIHFFNEGQFDWDLPVFGSYGGERGGMFGQLLNFLKFSGFDIYISGITKESILKADVLVFINLNRMLNQREKELLLQFVNNGGSLLVLGDHTGREIIREPYNDLLEPFGIKFNFDSAIPSVPKWENGFQRMHHFINLNIRDENDFQIGIGASLSLTHPARPVIIAKNAFSDLGDLISPQTGYLGDMRYTEGEKLGDLSLVAESRYGKGTALVFGDTSSFQNSALALSSDFVARVFAYLSSPSEKFWYRIFPAFDFILLSAFFVLLFSKQKQTLLIVPLFLLYSIVLAFSYFYFSNTSASKSIGYQRLALIDASHFERISTDLWGEPDGFGGLTFNLLRNNFTPYVMRDFDSQLLSAAQMLVIVAPAKPFSNFEIGSINTFVQNGGLLIVSVGWMDYLAANTLLTNFGIFLSDVPLGSVSAFQNKPGISFHSAWPIIFNQSTGKSLCDVWDFSVVAYTKFGNGGVLIVGDSKFFLNRNLEGIYNYNESNIIFFKDILATVFNKEK